MRIALNDLHAYDTPPSGPKQTVQVHYGCHLSAWLHPCNAIAYGSP